MKWFVTVSRYQPADIDRFGDGGQPQRRSLRTRYCLCLGVATGVIALLAWNHLPDLLSATAAFLLEHWPWLLAPLVGLVVGYATMVIADVARFFEEFSAASFVAGWVIGVPSGLLFAVALDSPWQLQHFPSHVPGGPIALLAAVIVAIAAAVIARRWDDPGYEPEEYIAFVVIGVISIVLLCVVGAALTRVDDWSLVTAIGSLAWRNGVLLILAAVALLNILAWRWSSGLRAEPTPVHGSEDYLPADRDSLIFSSERSARRRALQRRSRYFRVGLLILVDLPVLLYFVLGYLPPRLVDVDGLTAAQTARTLSDERRTLLAVLAGAGAAVTLVYTHLRHQLDRDANATGRYAQSIEQIGSAALNVRLGGIYALGRLQRDSPDDAKSIRDVLAAFIRQTSNGTQTTVAPDVAAAIRVLGESDGISESVDLRGCRLTSGTLEEVVFPVGADLSAADLIGVNLSSASLISSRFISTALDDAVLDEANLAAARFSAMSIDRLHLRGANLADASMADVVFSDAAMPAVMLRAARLDKCSFINADLDEVDLEDVRIRECTFKRSSMRHARLGSAFIDDTDFQGSDLEGAYFSSSYLSNVDFSGANLADTYWQRTQLVDVNLTNARLTGADLRRATLAEVRAVGCVYDQSTRWPPGIDPLEIGAVLVADA